MFKALDRVSYDGIQLNKSKRRNPTPAHQPKSLLDLSCDALIWNMKLVEWGIEVLPVHLVPLVLHTALTEKKLFTIMAVISRWPLHTLRLRDMLTTEDAEDLDEAVSLVIFQTLMNLKPQCKLECLDLRGVTISEMFSNLLMQVCPLLSLPKCQRKVEPLSKMIFKELGLKEGSLYNQVRDTLTQRLSTTMLKTRRIAVLPKGRRLQVKMDSFSFSCDNSNFIDYLITQCLSTITPLYITIANLYIRSDLMDAEDIPESLPQYIVLNEHNTDLMVGLSARHLDEGNFFDIASRVKQCCPNLHSLDMQDCNIYLQTGITRSRTHARSQLTETLSGFRYLRRLDVSYNYLLGCFGEVLDSLESPLEYLNIRGCDINEGDLTRLAESKHAGHLRELNLSKLCQFSISADDRISPTFLLHLLKHFPNLRLLNLSQNILPDTEMVALCESLPRDLTQLKGLNLEGNIIGFDSVRAVTCACAKIKSMQYLSVTCVNGLMNEGGAPHHNHVDAMVSLLNDQLQVLGRSDILVDVVKLSFAILVDIIGIFD